MTIYGPPPGQRYFYTYLHCTPDWTPFYVGKGFGRRAYRFSRRNKHHTGIVKKYGEENIIIRVFFFKSEQEAFDDERAKIADLRKQKIIIANYGDGGEGPSGVPRSPETRAKMRVAKLGNTYGRANKGKPNGWEGRKLSEAHKEKISGSLMGHPVSDESREKMAKAKIGNKNRLGGFNAKL